MDPGETFAEAAYRETIEEAGIGIQLVRANAGKVVEGCLRSLLAVRSEFESGLRTVGPHSTAGHIDESASPNEQFRLPTAGNLTVTHNPNPGRRASSVWSTR